LAKVRTLDEQEVTETTEKRWPYFSVSSVYFVSFHRNGPAMHPLFTPASNLTHDVIGAAIEVHKDKGPGLLESIYEWCLTKELELRGHQVQNQELVKVRYKQFEREYPLRFDLLVNRCLFVEVKAVAEVHPINKAQLLSYMKLLDIPLGLVVNFNVPKLTDGVSRLILPGANLD
jgi:GxxExxY protein